MLHDTVLNKVMLQSGYKHRLPSPSLEASAHPTLHGPSRIVMQPTEHTDPSAVACRLGGQYSYTDWKRNIISMARGSVVL
jgi:hypothetical protein